MTRKWIRSWIQMLTVLAVGLALAACLRTQHKVETVHTINAHITLDIRQVKDDIDDVESYVREGDAADTANESPISLRVAEPREIQVAMLDITTLDIAGLLATSAEAAQPSDAELKKAIESRRARAREIMQELDDQRLGEDDKGYVAVLVARGADAYKALTELSEAENADRKTIYIHLAYKAGGNESNLPEIEATSAQTIREGHLRKGAKFRVPRDAAQFKAFRESDFGKAYGEVKPGDWVSKIQDARK